MKKILFIDDEESILKITKILLNGSDVEVILSNSGEEATKILSAPDAANINLIFLDWTMPGMSGHEVLTWVKKKKLKIPVILQTGINDKKEIKKAMELGATDFLIKPYSKEKLQQMLAQYAN